jgi:hypothetical protein
MTPIPGNIKGLWESNESRRRIPFNTGDLIALAIGAAMTLCMIVWFVWGFSHNVLRDRAVVSKRPVSAVRTH